MAWNLICALDVDTKRQHCICYRTGFVDSTALSRHEGGQRTQGPSFQKLFAPLMRISNADGNMAVQRLAQATIWPQCPRPPA